MNLKKIIAFALVLALVGCTNINYKRGISKFNDKEYNLAINYFENCISETKKQPIILKSKIYRSSSFFALGRENLANKNYKIAADYFFLANSDKADSLLDDCYFELAKINLQQDNFAKSVSYLDFIINNLKDSDIMPFVLFQKVQIQNDNLAQPYQSYDTFKILARKYNNTKSYEKAKKIVNSYMPEFLKDIKVDWKKANYQDAIDKLLMYSEYPADNIFQINSLIANVYFSWANDKLNSGDLLDASNMFKKSLEYQQDYEGKVDQKLNQICQIYVKRGDQLLQKRKIDAAIKQYQSAFQVIEGCLIAKNKISNAEQLRENIEKANKLVVSGDQFFSDREYRKALEKYKAAYSLDNNPNIAAKIDKAKLWIKIKNEPEKFAQEIISNYQNGNLIKKINLIKREAQLENTSEDVRITPWQIMRSPSRNNYEVRYSIFTPTQNYLFFWLVKLETQQVIPLNNTTEELME